MVYTAPTGTELRRKRGSLTNKIATELSLIDTELGSIELGEINLTSAQILVGSALDAATAVAMSGDVTIDNVGATTIGAKKVTAAKMYSAAAGKILVTQASNAIAEKTITGAISMDADGVVTLAATAANVANVAADNVIGGIPVIFEIAIEDGTANNDITSTHRIKVIDFWFVGGDTQGSTSDTVQLKNGVNAITLAIAKTTVSGCLVRATSFDNDYTTIAAGGTIRVAAVKDTNVAGTAYVMAIRVAA